MFATASWPRETRTTNHPDLGATAWFGVHTTDAHAPHAAWQHTDLPAHAAMLRDRVAFAWRAMEACYEEDDRIIGHAADTHRPLALYESGFAPRWYVPRDDIDAAALTPVDGQTFCPYKGFAGYYDIGGRRRAAWSYPEAWPEVAPVSDWVSFEPDLVDVYLDGRKLAPEPGQTVVPHGIDRDLDVVTPALGLVPASYVPVAIPPRPSTTRGTEPRTAGRSPVPPAPRPARRVLGGWMGRSRTRRLQAG